MPPFGESGSRLALTAGAAAAALLAAGGIRLWLRRSRQRAERESLERLAARLSTSVKELEQAEALNLINQNLDDTDALALCALLRRPSCALEELYVWNNNISHVGVAAIGHVLPLNTSLRALWLSRNALGDAGVVALARGLRRHPALTDLRLAATAMSDHGACALARALAGGSLPLKELHLSANAIGDRGARALARALLAAPDLQLLALNSNRIGEPGARALGGCLLRSAVRELWIGHNPLGDEGALAVSDGALGGVVERLSLVDVPLSEAAQAKLRENPVWSSGYRALAL